LSQSKITHLGLSESRKHLLSKPPDLYSGGEKLKNTYVHNVRQMLRRNGLSPKYEYPGIYCIKLNERVVYIGKSLNMLERIAEHYVGINTGSERKYRIIWEVS
jgi:hypothetical protein